MWNSEIYNYYPFLSDTPADELTPPTKLCKGVEVKLLGAGLKLHRLQSSTNDLCDFLPNTEQIVI